jgi:hypothetical protein
MKTLDEGSPELLTPGIPNTTNLDTTPIATPDQGVKDWPGTYHPFYELADLIEEVLFMLEMGRRRRKTATKYLERIIKLLPWFGRQAGGLSRLLPIAARLKNAIRTPNRKGINFLLEEAAEILRMLIVADEDAKFPGCRNEEGEFVLA